MRIRLLKRAVVLIWALICLATVGVLAGCSDAATNTPSGVISETEPPALTAEPEIEGTLLSPALIESRQIVLEWPERIREKDSDLIYLSLVMDEAGQLTVTAERPGNPVEGIPVIIPNIYDTHNVVAVARLDIAGLDSWRDEIREPMRPGRPVTFRWSIRAEESGIFRGVVWLHLEFVPKEGGQTETVTLLARPIEIESVTIMGMSGWLARSLGGVGLVLSTLLGYPFIQQLIATVSGRRKPRAAAAEHPVDKPAE